MEVVLVNNNLSPLPFYTEYAFQNHRKDYAFDGVYSLITHANMLLPFQVVISSGSTISSVSLYRLNKNGVLQLISSSLLNDMIEAGLTITAYQGFSIIKYPGILPITSLDVHEGRYCISIRTNAGVIWSDIFTICNDVSNYLELEYYNSYNLELKGGMIDFSNNFKFKCYLDTQIGKPDYVFEEEATARMGYTFIESQISKKVYKFTFLAPEYLCDALRIVRLCDNKRISSKGYSYDLTTFNLEPEWQEQGDLAAVSCEFETDTVIANLGGYKPVVLHGDFNKDFNTDFNNV